MSENDAIAEFYSADCEQKPLIDSKDAEEKFAEQSKNMREISTKEAYFASLNEWVLNANISQNAMALFPFYLMNTYPNMFQQTFAAGSLLVNVNAATAANNAAPPPNINPQIPEFAPAANANGLLAHLRIMDEQAQNEFINRVGGYECVMAPFWKRAVAEIIDMVILLVLKVMVAFLVMNVFDLDLGFDLDQDMFRKAVDDDDFSHFLTLSMDFLAFSSDLLFLEVLTKLMVCVYEALWTTYYSGATPGKAIMRLRILYVEAVRQLQPPPRAAPQPVVLGFQQQQRPMLALVFPLDTPKFLRALMRALAKNLIMTLLFPMCFVMMFFKNNRTAYDILTKTIVIENDVAPVLRRQR